MGDAQLIAYALEIPDDAALASGLAYIPAGYLEPAAVARTMEVARELGFPLPCKSRANPLSVTFHRFHLLNFVNFHTHIG